MSPSIACTSAGPAPGGSVSGRGALRVIEIVDVDDVAAGRPGAREARRKTNDVVLDHHLGVGGDEDVKARLARAQPQLEGAPGDAGHELEEARALARRLGEHLGIGADDDILGAHAMRGPPVRRARLRLRFGGRQSPGRGSFGVNLPVDGPAPPAVARGSGRRDAPGLGGFGGAAVSDSVRAVGRRMGIGSHGAGEAGETEGDPLAAQTMVCLTRLALL